MNKEKRNKVICLINHLGPGGAQRQMVYLANVLINRNIDVKLIYYHNIDNQSHLLNNNVDSCYINHNSKFDLVKKLKNEISLHKPNTIISYIDGPDFLAIIYKILNPFSNTKIITSERNFNVNGFSVKDFILRLRHVFATNVVCNSYSQAQALKKNMPHLAKKTCYIANVLDFKNYTKKSNFNNTDTFKFVVPASYIPSKNIKNVLKAVKYMVENYPSLQFKVEWFGSQQLKANESPLNGTNHDYVDSQTFINKNQLKNYFQLNDVDPKLIKKMSNFDCLLLASFYEGCPNAIMDGMASGLPVICSDVGDNPRIIDDKRGGYLINPYFYKTIADAMLRMIKLENKKRISFGNYNYNKSIELFSSVTFSEKYLKVISHED